MKKMFNWLIIVLTIHIYSVQSKLLYHLNPEFIEGQWHNFTYSKLDEPSILAMIFALSYSIATAFVIYLSKKRWMILSYAVFDGLAVGLYYFTDTPRWINVVYMALYTFFLIASTTFIRNTEEDFDSQVSGMKESGMTQKEIANRTGKSESTISRIIKRFRN